MTSGGAGDPSPLSLEARLAAIAHEIATPLAMAAHAAAEIGDRAGSLCEDAAVDLPRVAAELRAGAEAVRSNLARAERLLASFKRVAAWEAGRGGAPLVFGLLACVRDAVDSMAPALRRARARVVLEGDDGLELRGDPGAVAQVVVNLVWNAAQHGRAGGGLEARIDVGVARADGRGGAVLTVRDRGAGIARERLGRIFEPLYSSVEGEGRGLGLAIVKEIVERRLGGEVAVESEEGRGTTFSVTMPTRER